MRPRRVSPNHDIAVLRKQGGHSTTDPYGPRSLRSTAMFRPAELALYGYVQFRVRPESCQRGLCLLLFRQIPIRTTRRIDRDFLFAGQSYQVRQIVVEQGTVDCVLQLIDRDFGFND